MKLGYTFTTIHFGGKYCTFYSLYIHLISLVTSCFADRCIRHKDADSQTLLFCQQLESIRKENVANVVHSNTVHACKYVLSFTSDTQVHLLNTYCSRYVGSLLVCGTSTECFSEKT